MKVKLDKEIEFNNSYDVIVAGGGPAGCAAAAAAARNGAKTLLIENTNSLGGMGTNGLVPAWSPFSDKEKVIYGGIASEVFENLKKKMEFIDQTSVDWVPISSEKLKRVYDDLVLQSGADVWFNTFICDAQRNGDKIDKIIIANKCGISALGAKIFIDATGDGDLAAFAGADFEKGDKDGNLQASTFCFKLANIDTDHFNEAVLSPESDKTPIYDILKSGKYPEILDEHLCCSMVDEGVLGFNAGHILGMDSSNIDGISKGIMLGRKTAEAYRNALAEFMPDVFGKSCVVSTATVMGTRESRRIKGEYSLTADDYYARRTFPDEIARNCYFIDVHASGKRAAMSVEERKANVGDCSEYGPGESYGIPFRCLIPVGFDNFLTSGRIISCDRQVFGSIRVMPCCLTTGEAAGTAAAIAASNDSGIHGVDINELRKTLKKNNAYFN